MLYNERHPFDLKKKRDGFKKEKPWPKKEKLKIQKQKTQPRLGFLIYVFSTANKTIVRLVIRLLIRLVIRLGSYVDDQSE